MARAGLGKWVDKAFTPHVTMLYDRRLVAEQVIAHPMDRRRLHPDPQPDWAGPSMSRWALDSALKCAY
jgi:hypothetical protein